MSMFDFTLNDASGWVMKDGHYSRCDEHEATREEVLLWRRVLELERMIERARPAEVRTLLDKIPTDADTVRLSPQDFALLRQGAQDVIQIVVHPMWNKKGILGELPVMRDGARSCVWLGVDRDISQGEVLVEARAEDIAT